MTSPRSEDQIFEGLNRLGRILMAQIEGHDTIGGFHLKEARLPSDNPARCDEGCKFVIMMRDSRLNFYLNRDDAKTMICEFNGFEELSYTGRAFDFELANELLDCLQRELVLDALASI